MTSTTPTWSWQWGQSSPPSMASDSTSDSGWGFVVSRPPKSKHDEEEDAVAAEEEDDVPFAHFSCSADGQVDVGAG